MKPKVICHMLSPLDGRLLLDHWAPEGDALREAMHAEYQRLHVDFNADAWLAGTTTMEDFATGTASPAAAVSTQEPQPRPWHLADSAATRFAIAIDRSARLHWTKPTADEGHVVVVLTGAASDAHLAELIAARVSYLVMPGDDIELAEMLAQLHARLGIEKLLLEGGAKINGAFLKAGLVDEVSLLVCPAIDGTSGKPTIFEAGEEGLGASSRLELKSARPGAANTVHLLYDVVHHRPG